MALELLGGGAVAGVAIACGFMAALLFVGITVAGSWCVSGKKLKRKCPCGKLLFCNAAHRPRDIGMALWVCFLVIVTPVALIFVGLVLGLVLGLAPQTVGMMIAVTVGGTLGLSCCCSCGALWVIWNGHDWVDYVDSS
ncbi:hypothetical protein Pelo_6502 [Pelomyxa schiedti]|nr:hypothetical protein Pelo_6502 [Pelomyxa schiedti]